MRGRFRAPPWPPDLEGGLGAAAGPAVVAGCGQNGGRPPPGWWRRPVGPGLATGVGLVRNRRRETGGGELGGGRSGGGELVGGGSSGGGATRAREDGSAAGASNGSG
jgi:hypothetical protein